MTELVVRGGMTILGGSEAAAAKSACASKAKPRAQPNAILPKTAMINSCSGRRQPMSLPRRFHIYLGS
jgi:hypothetical protein